MIPVMREAILTVQMVCYRRVVSALAGRQSELEPAQRLRLAGAVINNLFGTRPEDSEVARFGTRHPELVEQELYGLKETLADMLPLLTDALRMQTICDNQEGIHSIGSLLMARTLGLLDENRSLPMPSTFMLSVRTLAATEGLVEPMSRPDQTAGKPPG
ncbi:MAG: hypothetical protein CSA34_03815 [Desulfobulbus propionicus]|nr:MAG: hypothetical protein CSA34_03815 [Desulfobulbus propionicus]